MTPRVLLERLASAIPGYSGYAALEKRRETDQAVRRELSRGLGDQRLAVQRQIAEAARAMRLDALEPLESLARRLDRLADHLRHAPAGYSGLFAAEEVGVEALDRLTGHDARLRDDLEELAAAIDALSGASPEALRRAERSLGALESAVRVRDELLAGGA